MENAKLTNSTLFNKEELIPGGVVGGAIENVRSRRPGEGVKLTALDIDTERLRDRLMTHHPEKRLDQVDTIRIESIKRKEKAKMKKSTIVHKGPDNGQLSTSEEFGEALKRRGMAMSHLVGVLQIEDCEKSNGHEIVAPMRLRGI